MKHQRSRGRRYGAFRHEVNTRPDPNRPVGFGSGELVRARMDAMLGDLAERGIQPLTFDQPACRACGCTEDRACDPPCWWVADDLCSGCLAR